MKNIFLLVVFLMFNSVAYFNAKANRNISQPFSTYQYYISITGVDAREDVLSLQDIIQKKAGVTYFMADRFPVRCFILKSSRVINKKEFESWISSKYKISSYGEGDKAKEAAYSIYNKHKKSKS